MCGVHGARGAGEGCPLVLLLGCVRESGVGVVGPIERLRLLDFHHGEDPIPSETVLLVVWYAIVG